MNEPDYQPNVSLEQIAADLKGETCRSVLLTTHAKPDGDALGSVAALAEALVRCGRAVECRVMPPVPRNLRFLMGPGQWVVHDEHTPPPAVEPDRIIVVDTGARSQLQPLIDWIEARRDRVIVIDHHLHGDDIAARRFVDGQAAAACEIVADLVDALGVPVDEAMGQALFTGIASDTGWFRFSNVRGKTHRLAARLLELGIDHSDLYARTEQGERPEKLALMTRALASTRLIADGRAAVMSLRESDFADTGARPDETERFVDLPQAVSDVQVVALLVEQGELTRLSLRSKPGDDAVDVNQLAQQFGGGGHARAAGAKVDQPLSTIESRLIEAIIQVLSGQASDTAP